MKFLDVKTDFAFKKVFGSENSKDILISFLNALIVFPDNLKIASLEIVDPYNIPMLKGMKDTFVDVKAFLDNKTSVIIEMQVLNVEAFEKRILYNAAKKYSMQLVKGENYNLLNPIIALTIVDFEMFKECDKIITNFKMIEKDEYINYSDDIELIFVELPKFNKKLSELKNVKDKWIYFLKNAGNLDMIPKNMEEEIEKAFTIINEAGLTEEELEAQHKRHDFIWMQKSSIEKASKQGIILGIKQGLEQGLEQGMEKGIEKGIEQGINQMVREMNSNQISISKISKITKLTEDDIRDILS